MSKLGRLWDWLLPGLICLSPMGAVAYYSARDDKEAPRNESKRAGRDALATKPLTGSPVIPFARL